MIGYISERWGRELARKYRESDQERERKQERVDGTDSGRRGARQQLGSRARRPLNMVR